MDDRDIEQWKEQLRVTVRVTRDVARKAVLSGAAHLLGTKSNRVLRALVSASDPTGRVRATAELADALKRRHVSDHDFSEALRRLMDAGYVRREADNDYRVTPKGTSVGG